MAVAGEEACSRRAVLADRLTRAEADLVTARECESRVSTIEPLLRALEQLSRYLQNNEFKDYLMRRRERHLLGVATDILRRMTDDRHAFAERFQILDGLTQQTRDARTLSGGEKFLASLAVALALVEIASQASGKLDALFSDEGFGSLDGAALDAAVAELAARASFGKMIGIITTSVASRRKSTQSYASAASPAAAPSRGGGSARYYVDVAECSPAP